MNKKSIAATVAALAASSAAIALQTTEAPEPTAILIERVETSSALETESSPEAPAYSELTEEITLPPELATLAGTLYWTDSGEVVHTSRECSSLARTKNVVSGSAEAAFEAGKSRLCSRCDSTETTEAATETTAPRELPPELATLAGTLYWTDSGEVAHTSRECTSLARAKNVVSGSAEAAFEAGKSRLCARCDSTETTEAATETTAPLPKAEAYWTPSGTVVHIRADCPSLARSNNVASGSLEDALAHGKARVCKSCG